VTYAIRIGSVVAQGKKAKYATRDLVFRISGGEILGKDLGREIA
jgi:hypothetical protein